MQIYRGFKFKLYPTSEQEGKFRQFAGVCRLIYNLALEQRETWGKSHKINCSTQESELKLLRREFDFLKNVSQTAEAFALRDLDNAFKRFFRKENGYPTPRKKGRDDSFRFQGRQVHIKKLNAKWSRVFLPKIGYVRFRHTRLIIGRVCEVTVSSTSLGWIVSFTNEIGIDEISNAMPPVGIDRGVANTLTLSTGEMMSLPVTLNTLEKRHRSIQRSVFRRKKGSKRRLKAWKKANRIAAKRARIRKDWHHKASHGIAERFSVVVLEDLKVANMTASASGTIENPGKNVKTKSGLNRAIMNQGWGMFADMLRYKLEERGGELVTVNPAYTSQTCSCCGTVDRNSRKSQAVFSCDHCGFVEHADINAAVNILRRWNTPCLDVEEGSCPSCEASTGSGNAVENLAA